ncbi:DUF4270 domain-containing protein [Flavobacterium aestivum]|uniref:DUF4270 domain-containing protein n=1 Tax=Flavobacterium aestivum TaxID=3003257 RepID=UPI00228572D8|nr:DUF4270 domain-containing protein [Flavobacterium aestivum]
MLKKSFFKTIPFLLFIVLFNSCDKEYNVIGADLIGDSSFDLLKSESAVIAYNQKIGPIQSDDLPVNALGSYYNPSFGTTTANFVTQVNLSAPGTAIDASAKIKSVVLTIPYFYDKTKTVTNEDGSHVYVLDSIYGPDRARMKLSVYESGYYMRNLDPEEQFLKPQKYYTDQNSGFEQVKVGARLNDDPNSEQNDQFFFSDAEYTTTTTDPKTQVVTTTKNPPAMRLNLNEAFFESKILKAPAASLSTNDLFEDYFRGLYFNIEDSGSNSGNLNMINFKGGNITITYEETVVTNGVGAQVEKTLVLNMSGTTAEPLRSVSLLTQSNTNADYTNATNPANIDKVVGDNNLYLKGGEGSMAILNLFGPDNYGSDGVAGAPNGVADEIDLMRANKYLINEANLVFHVNAAAMGTSLMSQRIYLYDFTNNKVLIDYGDNSVVSSNSKNSKYVFGGILAKDAGGYYYKFRITNHVRNLIKNLDSKNVQIGLVVTEDINNSNFGYLKGTNPFPTQAPKASVMNPLGSIVYGGTSAVPADKRLKLEIYYTKAN